MHPQDALIALASNDTYIQTLNKFTCLVYSHQFLSLNKSLKHHNQIIYTCIFISKNCKIIQYLSVLCISSLVHRILLHFASLDRLWTWMLGQHVGCFTTSFYIYIRHSQSNPRWVYQTLNKSLVLISTTNHQPSQHSWVYQAINNNTCTYINNKRPFPGFISSSEL